MENDLLSDELLFDEKKTEEEAYVVIPKERRKIHFATPTRQVKDIHHSYRTSELDPRPEFQRGYVWDQKKASRLIESILLNVPIPPIYTSQQDDMTEIVIDGQQRLISIFSFMDGSFHDDNKDFKLRGLQVLNELNGKSFKDLERPIQRVLESYGLNMIVITKDSDSDVKFEIFERLNTGSVKLNDQELRNCIYRGNYNNLIKELSSDKEFQIILSSPPLRERMLDCELVLRFFAFFQDTYLNYKAPMKQFLNNNMERNSNLSNRSAKELKEVFSKSVELTLSVFGPNAFRRLMIGSQNDHNGIWETTKVNRGLFDIIMYGFTRYQKSQVIPFADAIREELIWLTTYNKEFIDAISGSATDKKEKIQMKFNVWLNSLSDILGYNRDEPRTFSLSLKKQLYDKDPTCSLCRQRIQIVDDAEIDHIDFYWRGGKTITSNARLTHRFCNRSRGSIDS